MESLSVLIVAAVDAEGLPWVEAAFAGTSEPVRVMRTADLPEAQRHLSAGHAADLVLLVESRPGEFASSEIEQLRRLVPLARFWRVLGSWSEGEQRSGRPPVGCTASYWHAWTARISSELDRWCRRQCPSWGMPLTATADERIAQLVEQSWNAGAGLVVVCAARSEHARALADACTRGGYQTLVVAEGQRFTAKSAVALVWDTPIKAACDAAQVNRLKRAAGGAPIYVVAGFPRVDQVEEAVAAGVAAVISKPYVVRDLWWHLAQGTATSRPLASFG
jgi:hypothetical protein